MKICFICVGQVKKAGVGEAASEYLKRIKRYAPVEVAEVKDEPATPKTPREEVLRSEGRRVLTKLSPGDFVVVLSDTGRQMTSSQLAKFMQGLLNSGRKRLVFIVGGAYGLHNDVYDASDELLSLSPMTLPHDLARLVLYEQVYRAFTILGNEPYSH
ncbi:MAG TPA: hypothetical protein DDW94_09840 [Deltaproteobacteria bacterium]|nr:MAG: hypothetical protein A2Z79_12435 [Deltaproteobacteria bacterium GWA2_55_82]OGQ63978.1 MAG: hypothetical protein A3I81_07965 [Deltaproteobacteria bacterium RIFCSPLOWO2_02_FULL_55_12]OIJ73411.1 MAG: hypothetical protein A2V21_303505 [Deltaproteobacteria bacterium GWC2_55_46]HBG47272.1 hypothetical protein [Deltaproteobacteria bacterium]HCY10038.1 hypothetical protein [Deltaproteobacteria bacterium]